MVAVVLAERVRFARSHCVLNRRSARWFKSQDDAQADKVKAREEVKSYIYQVMDTLDNADMLEKATSKELEAVEEACSECLEWMEQNADVEKAELDAKRREVERVVRPVMTKMYQAKMQSAQKGKKKSRR